MANSDDDGVELTQGGVPQTSAAQIWRTCGGRGPYNAACESVSAQSRRRRSPRGAAAAARRAWTFSRWRTASAAAFPFGRRMRRSASTSSDEMQSASARLQRGATEYAFDAALPPSWASADRARVDRSSSTARRSMSQRVTCGPGSASREARTRAAADARLRGRRRPANEHASTAVGRWSSPIAADTAATRRGGIRRGPSARVRSERARPACEYGPSRPAPPAARRRRPTATPDRAPQARGRRPSRADRFDRRDADLPRRRRRANRRDDLAGGRAGHAELSERLARVVADPSVRVVEARAQGPTRHRRRAGRHDRARASSRRASTATGGETTPSGQRSPAGPRARRARVRPLSDALVLVVNDPREQRRRAPPGSRSTKGSGGHARRVAGMLRPRRREGVRFGLIAPERLHRGDRRLGYPSVHVADEGEELPDCRGGVADPSQRTAGQRTDRAWHQGPRGRKSRSWGPRSRRAARTSGKGDAARRELSPDLQAPREWRAPATCPRPAKRVRTWSGTVAGSRRRAAGIERLDPGLIVVVHTRAPSPAPPRPPRRLRAALAVGARSTTCSFATGRSPKAAPTATVDSPNRSRLRARRSVSARAPMRTTHSSCAASNRARCGMAASCPLAPSALVASAMYEGSSRSSTSGSIARGVAGLTEDKAILRGTCERGSASGRRRAMDRSSRPRRRGRALPAPPPPRCRPGATTSARAAGRRMASLASRRPRICATSQTTAGNLGTPRRARGRRGPPRRPSRRALRPPRRGASRSSDRPRSTLAERGRRPTFRAAPASPRRRAGRPSSAPPAARRAKDRRSRDRPPRAAARSSTRALIARGAERSARFDRGGCVKCGLLGRWLSVRAGRCGGPARAALLCAFARAIKVTALLRRSRSTSFAIDDAALVACCAGVTWRRSRAPAVRMQHRSTRH